MKTIALATALILAATILPAGAQTNAIDRRAAAKAEYFSNRTRDQVNLMEKSAEAWKLYIAMRQERAAIADRIRLGLAENLPADQQRLIELKAALPVVMARYQQLEGYEKSAADRAATETARAREFQAAQEWNDRVNAAVSRQPVGNAYTRKGIGTGTYVGPAQPHTPTSNP